ncbi:hypothetical protein C4K68_07775 [Pokkaliibacter plantistimulans]|uniref:Uncharacterized protein n=1 Tax=Proteobacteria bacterium 228 TaxID=2083153 RepID=A0A2S5KUK7_9PROT|nr:hypothetical protein [Pokkaliibacter plantistimulans]PPC77936.1 hypothetical protein C4K68_07775 [Pokkaliibacter plantistimulans]
MNAIAIHQALLQRLQQITPASGYLTDLGRNVVEGFAVQTDMNRHQSACLFLSWQQASLGDTAATGPQGQSRKHGRQWQVEVLAPSSTSQSWWLQAEHDIVRSLSYRVGQRPLGQPVMKASINASQLHPVPQTPLSILTVLITLDYSETYTAI